MMNSFKASKILWAAWIAVVLTLVGAVWSGYQQQWVVLAVSVGVLFAITIILHSVRTIDYNIEKASEVMAKAAQGHLDVRILRIRGTDRLARVLRDVNIVLDLTESLAKESSASMTYVAHGKYFRRIMLKGMAGEYAQYATTINNALDMMAATTNAFILGTTAMGNNIIEMVRHISDTASTLQEHSIVLSDSSNDSSNQAATVTSAAEQAAANVEKVATATLKVSEQVNEVAEQVSRSAQMAQTAVNKARSTDSIILGLTEAADKIGAIVKLINTIASQTNLLALNATIEAARAGDAGKGFAVVANEVKNLATQTARATGEISLQINAMQLATADTVSALREITMIINNINDITAGVANSTTEQNLAVNLISRNVHDAADGVQVVAHTISRVADGVKAADEVAASVLTAADDISTRAIRLRDDMDLFVRQVCEKP